MAKPPAPPRRSADANRAKLASLTEAQRAEVEGLAQVEEAMASLEGRDVGMALDTALARRDHERVRKELETVAGAATAQAEAAARRRMLGRVGLATLALGVLGGLAWGGLAVRDWIVSSNAARDAARRAAAPFAEAGFENEKLTIDEAVTLDGERGRCWIAVAASAAGPQRVRFERGSATSEAASVGFCSCGPLKTVVRPVGPAGTGLALLGISAGAIGGADLLGHLPQVPALLIPETDDRACAEEAIDELVKATKTPPAPSSVPHTANRLASLGFTSVAGSAADAPFLALPADAKTCFVAVADEADAKLSLRLPGGARTVGAKGVVGLCQSQGATASVWPSSPTAIAVVAAPLADVGGTVGLREALGYAGHPDAPVVLTAETLAEDAKAIVLSSGASEAHVAGGSSSLLGLSEPPYLFGYSATDVASLPAFPKAGGVVCSPPLGGAPLSALCLGGEGAFDGLEGVRANRPEWLHIGTDPVSLERALALMTLTRRLALSEFELTTVGSFTETRTGADVVGRAGEAELVAVALGGSPPVIHTLSDEAPWDLAGEPRVIPLAPGAHVNLKATPPFAPLPPTLPGAPKPRRVIVLFRR